MQNPISMFGGKRKATLPEVLDVQHRVPCANVPVAQNLQNKL